MNRLHESDSGSSNDTQAARVEEPPKFPPVPPVDVLGSGKKIHRQNPTGMVDSALKRRLNEQDSLLGLCEPSVVPNEKSTKAIDGVGQLLRLSR